ncbi:YdcF family protein [Sedimenticola hydrogenitrophicus]|uniref:YdcF family protein n=1 Tax=Sedimenticola hydrogenitrophicus TaxID=2967975 RepID=UPI0021A89AD4|nr:YdcF family protein [Sedimenticola hydrogenitrophicus]
MSQEIVWTLKDLILPPGVLVLLGLIGLLMVRRLLGKLLLLCSVTALYLLSTPFFSSELMAGLESLPALTEAQIDSSDAQAIVVLGAGRRDAAAEFGKRDTVNTLHLERLRYAAWLSRKSGLPLITSGGKPRSRGPSEADLARDVLEQEFGVRVLAIEGESRTTREQAYALKPLLEQRGIRKIMLVTHAWHMLRALDVFEAAGIAVQPAPTGFAHIPGTQPSYHDWLPNAGALLDSYYALHEQLGRWWYRLLA